MLGIHRVGRGRGDYYLADLGRELPVSTPPRWIGGAAAAMGLDGTPARRLDADQFAALLEGRHPRTDVPLGSPRSTVAGFDLTFAAPKSASVLFALGGDETARRVVHADEGAVQGALDYFERHGVSATRRNGAERVVVPVSGVAAGLFTHGVNRNLDPHLHSHVVMANLVHGEDGRWSACDQRGMVAHRRAAAAVYDAHLRLGLTADLGVRWTESSGRMEIAGMAPALLGEFSSRSADIRRHMHEFGTHSARGHHIAWATTRPAKGAGTPYVELVGEWARRAEGAGWPGPELVAGLDRQSPTVRPALDEHRYGAVIALTPHGGARRRDVVEAFAVAATTGASAQTLDHLAAAWVPTNQPIAGPPAGLTAVGVAEPLHARREVVPGNHLLRALGPRPVEPADHDVWLGAARVVEAYRERWGVTRSPEPLGIDAGTPKLAALTPQRLVDHLRATRCVDEARTRLGRREPQRVELGRGR